MFGSRREHGDKPRRLSSRAFVWAIAATLLVFIVGNAVVWRLYRSSFVHEAPARAEAQSQEPLTVGIGRTPGGPREWETYAKVFAQLQKDLGRPIKVRYVLDGNDSADLLEQGELDVAIVSTRVYLGLEQKGVLTLVAAPVISGRAKDAAILVVNSASRFKELDDLRGEELLVSKDSLAGRAFITWYLNKRGETPRSFFRAIDEEGVQDANLTRLAKGEVAATCVRRSALASWPAGTIRVLAESPEFGMPPVVARKGLDAATVSDIRRSLLSASGRGILPAGTVIKGFAVTDDADYDFARKLELTGRTPSSQGEGEE
ncbi:MAG TPA: PhnD/SsuA/transferrin family substrate-binding protein [Coriobacteriia bacterium]|nr:PhnD/SsuA/transferrin family substrate-binding protein [Coriobacteriia bacterium]